MIGLATPWTLLAALVLMTIPMVPARAGDADTEPLALEMHVIPVRSLTVGRPWFMPPTPPEQVEILVDEERPFFAFEAEEPILPIGGADELVERVKYAVASDVFDNGDADLATSGERFLVVHAPAEVVTEVAEPYRVSSARSHGHTQSKWPCWQHRVQRWTSGSPATRRSRIWGDLPAGWLVARRLPAHACQSASHDLPRRAGRLSGPATTQAASPRPAVWMRASTSTTSASPSPPLGPGTGWAAGPGRSLGVARHAVLTPLRVRSEVTGHLHTEIELPHTTVTRMRTQATLPLNRWVRAETSGVGATPLSLLVRLP